MKNKKLKAYQFGILSELFITIYMFFCGYRLIKRRYKNHFGEIDLIFMRWKILSLFIGKLIIFGEVKARKSKQHIFDSLSQYQLNRIKKSAEYFINKNKLTQYNQRFDLFIVRSFLILPIHCKNIGI